MQPMKLLHLLLLMQMSLCANVLLEKPHMVTASDLEAAVANWQTCFQWKCSAGCNFVCTYQEGKAGFLVQALWMPVRSYNFPYYSAIKQLLNTTQDYYFDEPLILQEQHPKVLTADELCTLIQDKKVVFYTGAGISASSNVATMHNLEESLALGKGTMHFLKRCFFSPTSITQAFDSFCRSAIEAPATPAHYALHQLARYKECAIVTENVDLLQQRAGSHPLFTHSDAAHSITSEGLQAIDIVICIGLSQDDCGLLAHYKKIHPQGMLIAINRNVPNYVSHDDYIVQDDIQVVLPYVANCL